MGDILFYVFVLALLALAAAALLWVARSYFNGQSPSIALFGPKPERRLGIVEQASVDGRRRLVLIRRDGIEHLIMTGGPVDVVIETGIGERKVRTESAELAQTVYARQPRSFGQPTAERPPERAAE